MEPITLGILAVITWATAAKVVSYKKEQTKQKKLKAKSQIELAKLEATKKDLEQANKEKEEVVKKLKDNQEKLKKAEREAEEIRNKLKNPTSKDEERRLRGQLALKEEEISGYKNEDKKHSEKIKALDKRIEGDLKTINSIEPSSLNEEFNLKDYLNLETAMIVIALFVVYQLLLKNDRK